MPFSIRLDDEIERRLTALAKRTGRSKAHYVREAVRVHIDELEELYRADGLVQGWVNQGRPSRPAEQLWAELEG